MAALTACSGGDSIEAARDGGSLACAALVARLPASVLGRDRRDLDVAGAARWGDPAIVLRCGVPPTGPTSDYCIDADDVQWTFRDLGKRYRFTTYGRTPAVEVVVPSSVGRTNATSALIDLTAAVRPLPVGARCVGPDDA